MPGTRACPGLDPGQGMTGESQWPLVLEPSRPFRRTRRARDSPWVAALRPLSTTTGAPSFEALYVDLGDFDTAVGGVTNTTVTNALTAHTRTPYENQRRPETVPAPGPCCH
jgi:hypothetical protein